MKIKNVLDYNSNCSSALIVYFLKDKATKCQTIPEQFHIVCYKKCSINKLKN